jgi:predicted RNA-binding protein with PUA-like domain
MKYWIMKSEPSVFSIDDLKNKKEAFWDGVRNYQVRNMMQKDMAIGDKAFFYHSSCEVPGIVGYMEIISEAKADPTQFDKASPYFDAKSTKENPRWAGVEVRFVKKYTSPLSLATLRTLPKLASLTILQKGNRLSITEVTTQEAQFILSTLAILNPY